MCLKHQKNITPNIYNHICNLFSEKNILPEIFFWKIFFQKYFSMQLVRAFSGIVKSPRRFVSSSTEGLKQMNQITRTKIPNSYLQALTPSQLRKYNLNNNYSHCPKLSLVVLSCLSIFNRYHPGFNLLFMGNDGEQLFCAHQLLTRMWLENSMKYDHLWPINLTGRDRRWNSITVGDLWRPGTFICHNFSHIYRVYD